MCLLRPAKIAAPASPRPCAALQLRQLVEGISETRERGLLCVCCAQSTPQRLQALVPAPHYISGALPALVPGPHCSSDAWPALGIRTVTQESEDVQVSATPVQGHAACHSWPPLCSRAPPANSPLACASLNRKCPKAGLCTNLQEGLQLAQPLWTHADSNPEQPVGP